MVGDRSHMYCRTASALSVGTRIGCRCRSFVSAMDDTEAADDARVFSKSDGSIPSSTTTRSLLSASLARRFFDGLSKLSEEEARGWLAQDHDLDLDP